MSLYGCLCDRGCERANIYVKVHVCMTGSVYCCMRVCVCERVFVFVCVYLSEYIYLSICMGELESRHMRVYVRKWA
jgi:hypothetical protein